MRLTFRGKLLGIVAVAAAAFLILIAASALLARRADERVRDIREHLLPKIELGPQLETQLDRIRRGLQDAVAAHDPDLLDKARDARDGFRTALDAVGVAISPAEAAGLSAALDEYYAIALDVSRRLMNGETGESLVGAMTMMQVKQARVATLLGKAVAFDRRDLGAAFDAAARAHLIADRVRMAVSIGCLALVLTLSLLVSRGLLRSLSELTSGFTRFGEGQFDQRIVVHTTDELAELAERANQMAANLAAHEVERERTGWLESGQAKLAAALRGELEPRAVAERATRVLATHLEAPAAAFYAHDRERGLSLLGHYAYDAGAEGAAAPSFALGQGLVGQAALQEGIVVINDPPVGYLRVRSGLGDGAPKAIALLPLARLGKPLGVLELATFKPWSERSTQLLSSISETLAIALEVADARARAKKLLHETQEQATRLANQEEELRQTNEELATQAEELRQTNEELSTQTEALQAQRGLLVQRNAELDDARLGLERKATELSNVSSYKSQFLTNMSHELRTPLNSMLLLSNLLAENAGARLSEKQVEYARTIHSAGKDLLGLINQVLDLAKVEAGKQEIRVEPVTVRPIIDHLTRVFEPLANDKGLRLRVEVAAEVPAEITTDRQRLEQIVRNLVGNAIKFTERGGVTLSVRVPTRRVVLPRGEVAAEDLIELAVTDTGMGIAPEHQQRIFAPFEQVEAASDRRHAGTGLGLAISRELAILLGGDLRLESAVGQGSTFTCTLPRVWSSTSTRPAPPAPGRTATEVSIEVLVVEDDAGFSGGLSEIIEAQGLVPIVASTGAAALRLARERRPRGVILDVRLPDLDGWSVMEQLRADPITASIPVHFISAVDASARGLAMGAIGYLTKPVTREDLLRVLEALSPRRPDRLARPCRILLVEDDAVLGESLARQLSSDQLEIVRAATGSAALQAVRSARFDCMILDLSLPDSDGFELLQLVEKECGPQKPSVVVYTARALTQAETRRLESYAEAIVVKDGSSQERLLEEIRLFVRRLKDGLGPRRPARGTSPADLRLQGKKILLADDDIRTIYALSATLSSKGADVLTADNGREALALLAERPDVDVVLMDIMMPEMDGYEAMRRIRQEPRFARLPIVALTAKAMKGDAEKCIAAGATDYLSKPIDPDRLIELIHARLSA